MNNLPFQSIIRQPLTVRLTAATVADCRLLSLFSARSSHSRSSHSRSPPITALFACSGSFYTSFICVSEC